jgi:TetR/AcrR family transcriptional repressor of nem operon
MPLSKEHKAQTRERILTEAAALFRRDGIDGVSVPALMKQAGLTHGGFYAHFGSKDVLVAEVLGRSLCRTSERLLDVAKAADDPVSAVIDEYVSARHRDHPETGCAVAALGPEAARGESNARRVMTESIRDSAHRFREAFGFEPGREDDALALFAGMVGALVLARACGDDRAYSDHILEVCRDRLKKAART